MKAKRAGNLRQALRDEWFLGVSLATVAIFALAGGKMFAAMANPLWLALIFIWLFGVVLGSALSVVRHADHVAEVLGEPYGTLVLTLSVTAIEVMSISAVMLHGANNPTLVRDTLFAIVMIILGGMVGISLLAGGWRHREQHYNLQGANAYLGVIIPLAVLTLSLPNFTTTTPGPTLSVPQEVFIVLMSAGLYAAFLAVQTPAAIAAISRLAKATRSTRMAATRLRARWPGMLYCSLPTSCRSCSWRSNSPIRSTI